MSAQKPNHQFDTAMLLTHLQLERQDLTISQVREVLENGWKEVPGRTHRQLLIQLLDVLSQNDKLRQRQPEPGSHAWVEKTMELVELVADAEHANGKTVGCVHRQLLREHLAGAAMQFTPERLREICEKAAKAEFAFPPLRFPVVQHPQLGDLFDTLGCQKYALTVAEQLLKAAMAQIQAAAPEPQIAVNSQASAEGDALPPGWRRAIDSLRDQDDQEAPVSSERKAGWHAALDAVVETIHDYEPNEPQPKRTQVPEALGEWLTAIGELHIAMGRPKFEASEPTLGVVETLREATKRLAAQAPAAEHAEPARRVFLVATGEIYEGEETYTRHEDAPPPLCDSEVLYTQPAPAEAVEPPNAVALKDTGPYSFNCTAGCGECGVRLREFEHYRSETHEGELIERKTIPEIVSTCCGSEVEVWNSASDDVAAQVLAATPAHLKRQPTLEDVVAYLQGQRGPLHELIDDLVRTRVEKVRGEQLTARAEKTIAWEVVEHGKTTLLTQHEFTRRSFDTAAMRPLVYGDTPARTPLSNRELQDMQAGQAIQRGAEVLPDGYELQILVERHAGTVHLSGPEGDDIPLADNDGDWPTHINLAIDTALLHAKAS